MIELVSESRCIQCNLCVNVCPTNVFDAVPNAAPTIARQSDCQTCFMCELYCPVDALYVAPDTDVAKSVSESDLIETQLLGSYRQSVGWGAGRKRQAEQDQSYYLLKPLLAAKPTPVHPSGQLPILE